MLEGLDGKVALVTGAGRGLGRAEALELAGQGVRILVNDFGRQLHGEPEDNPADDVVAEIKGMGGEAVANYGDVADWDDAQRMVSQAVESFGRLDIVMNNAGFLRDRVIFNMTEEEFDQVVRVHLKGHFCVSRWACAYWRDQAKAGDGTAYGRLINTASESYLLGSTGQPNYGPAKGAIVVLTMSIAGAMARYGVTANVICPRARTRMTEDMAAFQVGEGEFDTFAPSNVSPLVAYLASPAAQKVSGQVFVVYGKNVTVVSGPKLDHDFEAAEPWTPESVAAAITPFYADRAPLEGYVVQRG